MRTAVYLDACVTEPFVVISPYLQTGSGNTRANSMKKEVAFNYKEWHEDMTDRKAAQFFWKS